MSSCSIWEMESSTTSKKGLFLSGGASRIGEKSGTDVSALNGRTQMQSLHLISPLNLVRKLMPVNRNSMHSWLRQNPSITTIGVGLGSGGTLPKTGCSVAGLRNFWDFPKRESSLPKPLRTRKTPGIESEVKSYADMTTPTWGTCTNFCSFVT